MKNHFTIEREGEKLVFYNTVLSAYEHWKNGLAYGKYISIMSGDKRIDKRTEVVSYNDDVGRGELFATFRAYLSKDEFPYDIERIGLCPTPLGELSNECTVSIGAATLIIAATVYLQATSEDFAFYPGDNALVRSLLGMEAKPEFTVYGGDALLPNVPVMCDTSDYVALSSTSLSDGVVFDRGDKVDLAIGDPPFLRYNAAYGNPVTVAKKETIKSGGAFLSGTVDVTGVKSASGQLPYAVTPVIKKLHPSGKEIVERFYDCELISDPLNKVVGIVQSGQLYIIGEDDGITVHDYMGTPMLCSDGSFVYKMGNVMYFNGSTKRATVGFGDYVALSRDGGYDIFVYNNGELHIFRYDGALTEKVTSEPGDGLTLSRFNEFSVVLYDSKSVRLFTASGEIEPYPTLKKHLGEQIKDGCYYGNKYMGNVWANNFVACLEAFNRFCNTDNGLYYIGENGSVKVGDFTIKGAAIAGEHVYFLSNGKLTKYMIEKSGSFLSVNGDGEVTCDEVVLSPKGKVITMKIGRRQ